MTNEELIDRFEQILTSEDSFRHSDHVRLAFAYLGKYPVQRALERFSGALKRFAESRGKTKLYHETITCAYFFLIHERMTRSEITTWDRFEHENADLLVWKGGILDRYYSEATLKSELARKIFILPDNCLAHGTGVNSHLPLSGHES